MTERVRRVQTGCKGGDADDADRGGGGGLSVRRQSKDQDASERVSTAAAGAIAEAKCDFNGQGAEAVDEDKQYLSTSLRSGGQTKWYACIKARTFAKPRRSSSLVPDRNDGTAS